MRADRPGRHVPRAPAHILLHVPRTIAGSGPNPGRQGHPIATTRSENLPSPPIGVGPPAAGGGERRASLCLLWPEECSFVARKVQVQVHGRRVEREGAVLTFLDCWFGYNEDAVGAT